MSEPRKHHYIPVFYQNKFANASGLLWLYDRKCQVYKELSPKVICFQKDLYALKPKDAPKISRSNPSRWPRLTGSARERCAKSKKGKNGPTFSTVQTIAYFAGLQSARLPTMARMVSANYKKGAEEIMCLTSVNVDRMKSAMNQYAESSGKEIDISPESMVEAIRGNQLKVTVTEVPFLREIFEHTEFLCKRYLRLSWEILIASPDTGFILTDDPCTTVPPKGVRLVGIGIPGSAKYFPLTRRLCLRLGDITRKPQLRYRRVERQAVRMINQNLAANSERFIMGPVWEQLEKVVQRSGSTEMDPTPRFTLQTTEENDDGSTQMLTQNPRRYFYLGQDVQAP